MKIKLHLATQYQRDFWSFIERTAAEVDAWPWWKIGHSKRCPQLHGCNDHCGVRCELAEGHKCDHRFPAARREMKR